MEMATAAAGTGAAALNVLIIDNYDSFVYNLAQYVGKLGGEPHVFRNDKITLRKVMDMQPDRIIISPGPGTPEDKHYFGVCLDVLHKVSPGVPTLGVCLGHQGIGYAFGGKIRPAKTLMHGKTSEMKHDGRGVLKGMRDPFAATRYHSLAIDRDSLPAELTLTSESMDDHEVMGVRHVSYPIEGVQYHPESIITQDGIRIIRNFLKNGVQH